MRILTLIFTVIMFLCTSVYADSFEVKGRFSSKLSHYRYNGAGTPEKDNTLEHLEQANLKLDGDLGSYKVGMSGSARTTDDRQVDSDSARLLSFHAYLEKEHNLFELGDVAANMNSYVFGAGLKGIKYSHGQAQFQGVKEKGLLYTLIAGTQEATWNDFYSNEKNTSADRLLTALETKYKFDMAKEMAISVAYVKDRPSSVVDGIVSQKSLSLGYDWDWRFNRYISTRGQVAISKNDNDLKDENSGKSNKALKIKLMTKPLKKSLSSDFLYEYVDAGYASLAGSSASDMMRMENNTSWRINRQIRLRTDLKRSVDNLENHLSQKQTVDELALSADLRPDFMKRGDFRYSSRYRKTKGRGADNTQYTNDFTFNFRPVAGLRYMLSWVNIKTLTKSSGNVNDQNIIRTGVNYNKSLNDDFRLRSGFKVDCTVTQPEGDDQKLWGFAGDLGLSYKDRLDFDLMASTRNAYRENQDDTYFRNYLFRTSYYPDEKRQHSLNLTVERREYDTVQAINEYSERLVTFDYSFNF